jgi:hypothetical protein
MGIPASEISSAVVAFCRSEIPLWLSMDTRLDHISSVISVVDSSPLDPRGRNVARYGANVDSSATINSRVDISVRPVVFNVGCVPLDRVCVARPEDFFDKAVVASFEVVDSVRAEVEASVRRVNGQSGAWRFADMSGVVHVLAASLAFFRAHGTLTMQIMKGGDDEENPFEFTSLRGETYDVSADSGKVYIPSYVVGQMQPGCLSAFLAAVNGAGGHCVTDVAGMGVDNRVRIPVCEDLSLALGCYDALSLLGKFYNANGVGELFSFAVTTGMHSVMTVHAHSDEGGFMREALRRIRYCTPYGGLSVSVGDFTGLPMPSNRSEIVKMVDSIVIQSAGCVSLADPMVLFEGKVYPTTLVSGYEREAREQQVVNRLRELSGDVNIGTVGDALSIARMLTDVYSDFCTNYSRLLGRMMGVEGGGDIVNRVMMTNHYATMLDHYRHLKFEVVNPFFWVESTASTRVECADMPCVRAGFGRLCAHDEQGSMPFFDGLVVKDSNNSVTAVNIRFVGARKHGLIHHLQGHRLDGLAHMHVRSLKSNNLINYGHGGRSIDGVPYPEGTIREKVEANLGLDRFLWGRGHSTIISPGEMLYTGEYIGFLLEHVEGDLYSPSLTHFPRNDELNGEVTFRVSSLQRLGVGRPDPRNTREDKRRKGAASALGQARIKHTMWRDVRALMPVSVEEEDISAPIDSTMGGTIVGEPRVFVGRFDAGQVIEPFGVQGLHNLPRLPGGARNNNQGGNGPGQVPAGDGAPPGVP